MKKMTKRLAWLLIIALLISTCLLSFVACDDEDDDDDVKRVATLNGKTPLEAFLAAEEKMELMENVEASGEIEATVEISGQGFSASQTMTSSMLMQMNGETMYSKTQNQSSGVENESSLEETWLVGGNYYEHTNDGSTDIKTKTPMTYDEYCAEHEDGETDEFFIDLDSGILDGAKFKKDGNLYHVDVRLTGDQVQQYAADLVDSFDGGSVDTLNYRMSFDKDGELKGFTISFSGATTESGMTMTMDVSIVIELRYGTVGTINPPEDAYRYVNAD